VQFFLHHVGQGGFAGTRQSREPKHLGQMGVQFLSRLAGDRAMEPDGV
jgi:hypothetical protein